MDNTIHSQEPKETHPVVQFIINNNLRELKNVLKDNDIDKVYPCIEWDDDITPLIAAVINHMEDICSFLLQQGADPNKVSKKGFAPLHYVSLSKAPITFVMKLLEAKANLNGMDIIQHLQRFTPLQTAAICDRKDILKELISAGACVTLLPITVPEDIIHNLNISHVIHQLALEGDELFTKISFFFDVRIAMQVKSPEEVFKTFDSHMMWKDPQTHLTIIEKPFNFNGEGKEQHSQEIIKWLKDNGNLNSYTAGAVSGFPAISQEALPGSKKKEKIEGKSEKQEDPNEEVCTASTDITRVPVIESTSNVKPFNTGKSSTTPKWFQISKGQREKLVGSIMYVNDVEFCIAKGSDGTEVFLGLRDDGTEVTIQKMLNVDFAEDENFGYLCLRLCENTLEEYIKDCTEDELYVIVRYILKSVKMLHGQNLPILLWDLNPQNFWTDVTKRVRLASFGLRRWLPGGQTTLYTGGAVTKNWMAKETLTREDNVSYNWSTDIQEAGILIYYILSRGHHPFGEIHECQNNILEGRYSLDHVQDELAKDLIECMINEKPEKRPRVEQCLRHPFFWPRERREEFLRRIGNRKEVAKFKDSSEEIITLLDAHGSFKNWKNKFPPELVQKMEGKKKEPTYSDNVFGLLRFIRNFYEHYHEYMDEVDVLSLFPDLFGRVYIFSKKQGWNSETPLKQMFRTEDAVITRAVMPPANSEEHLSVPVQESPHISTQPIAKALPQ